MKGANQILDDARKDLGFDDDANLAKELGYGPTSLSNWRADDRIPARAKKMIDLLRRIQELERGVGSERPKIKPQSVRDGAAERLAQDVVEAYDRLPEGQRRDFKGKLIVWIGEYENRSRASPGKRQRAVPETDTEGGGT